MSAAVVSAAGRRQLDRVRTGAWTAAIVGAMPLAIGALVSPADFFYAYLFAFLFWTGLAAGCLALLMLQHLTGGLWGLVISRVLEAGSATLPLTAALFGPLVLGLEYLYVWSDHAWLVSHGLAHKAAYLNVPFFVARASLYFAVWIALAATLRRWSLAQDVRFDARRARRMESLSAIGLVLYVATVTLAATDWVMSLDPRWYSTILGALLVGGQGLSALAFAIVAAAWLTTLQNPGDMLTTLLDRERFHELGNLLLAFVVLWSYLSFSQYLIIWAENLPEEILWYVARTRNGWQWLAGALMLLHFAVPMALLLFRRTKRSMTALAAIAGGVLVMRLVDLFWLVAPALYSDALRVHWLDAVAVLALGGAWVAIFVSRLAPHPLVPPRDLRLRGAGAVT
jgi:hypothetical protein